MFTALDFPANFVETLVEAEDDDAAAAEATDEEPMSVEQKAERKRRMDGERSRVSLSVWRDTHCGSRQWCVSGDAAIARWPRQAMAPPPRLAGRVVAPAAAS